MRVGIVARPEIPRSVSVVRKVMRLLRKNEILLYRELAKKLGKKGSSIKALAKADAIIAVGGDGTVLRAQRMAPDVPVLGVNLGVRGFLAEVETSELPEAVRMLTRGELPVVRRERLKATLGRRYLADALNDIVIAPEKLGKAISLAIEIEGETTVEATGDGVIVSTPTGSTAYARAAGGPVLDPNLDSFLLVPICPTRHLIPPLVLPLDKTLKIGLLTPGRDALVIADGERMARIKYGDEIRISRSERPATFFVWKKFYTKLKEKL
jgi:NAD+ kinase